MPSHIYPNILAVIPARSGSKGIPKKNLKVVNGKSLIARAVETAIKVPFITDVIISSDGADEIAEAETHGAKAPFIRPPELSSDTARAHETWAHALQESERFFNKEYEISVLLEPTSPLRRPSDLVRVIDTLLEKNSAAAASFSRSPAHYTPEKTLCITDEGRIRFFTERGHQHAYRQSLPKYYHRNGICYAVRRSTLLDDKAIIEKDCMAVVIDRPAPNIDDQLDVDFTEFLMMKYGDPLDMN